MITIEQLKAAKDRVEALYRYLDIEAKIIQLEEEQLRTQAPVFWDDAKKAEEQMKSPEMGPSPVTLLLAWNMIR